MLLLIEALETVGYRERFSRTTDMERPVRVRAAIPPRDLGKVHDRLGCLRAM